MPDAYLSTGFAQVDTAADPTAFAGCLTLIDSLPYFQKTKEESYHLMELTPGDRVLDAGCGLGDDAFRMAERVGETGSVTGLDASAKFIEQARSDPRAQHLPVDFQTADLLHLPFPDATFTRARIDRVLQHLAQPQAAISELARVLLPGGLLLAYDNDWDTLTITSAHPRITRLLFAAWSDSFPNGQVGRHLKAHFLHAGLTQLSITPGVFLIEDFETAERLLNLRQTATRATQQGLITEPEATTWLQDLQTQSHQRTLLASLTAYTVVGRK